MISTPIRFTLRWVARWAAIALVCAVMLVGLAALVESLRRPAPAPRRATFDELAAGALMPLDAQGQGTQIISDTTLVLTLRPYPARAGVTGTLTLVAIAPGAQPATYVSPTLYVASVGQSSGRELVMPLQADRNYAAAGIFFPQPGTYRLRVDVYVGDDTPASMLLSVDAR